MRILAVDYGKRRIGIAITDPLCIISQPLETIPYRSDRDTIQRLKCLVRENEVSIVLVGNPLSMSGKSTTMSDQVQRFAMRLQKALTIEVKLWDERLTSKFAQIKLKEAGIQKAKGKLDQIAACIILDEYLVSQVHCSA